MEFEDWVSCRRPDRIGYRLPQQPPGEKASRCGLPSHKRRENVSEERSSLSRGQLDCLDSLRAVAEFDGALPSGSQITDPVDVPVCADQESPAINLEDGHGRGARLATGSASHRQQGVGTHGHPAAEQTACDGVEESYQSRRFACCHANPS